MPTSPDQNLLTLSSAFTLHVQIAALAQEVGANIHQEYEGTSLDALRQMAAMDMGLTFLPALYVQSEISQPDADVAVVPFRGDRFTRSIGIVWRKTAGDATAYTTFSEIVRDIAVTKFGKFIRLED